MKRLIQKLLFKIFILDGQKTSMITLEKCPKCGSLNCDRYHHYGNFALPECFYQKCDDCEHQWGHS
jgi:hypothetical protein